MLSSTCRLTPRDCALQKRGAVSAVLRVGAAGSRRGHAPNVEVGTPTPPPMRHAGSHDVSRSVRIRVTVSAGV